MKTNDFLLELYRNRPCTVIDGGARGGFKLLPALHRFSEVHLVEPDPKAAEDLRKGGGPGFRKSIVHEMALAASTGVSTLHITAHSSMNSLLKPDNKEFKRGFGEMKNAEQWSEAMNVVDVAEVKISSLADFITQQSLPFIDFLKLDTQGNELDILKGGESLLRNGRIGVICSEVSFFPVYEGQSYFSDIDVFLRGIGFRLVECRSYPEVLEREDEFSVGGKLHERPKQAPSGDAWYVFNWQNDDSSTTDQRIRTAMVLSCEAYFSEAKYLLDGILTSEEQNELFRNLSSPTRESGTKHFLRRWTPPAVKQWRAKRRK